MTSASEQGRNTIASVILVRTLALTGLGVLAMVACGYGVALTTPRPSSTAVAATPDSAMFTSFVRQYVAVRAQDRQAQSAITIGTGPNAAAEWYVRRLFATGTTGQKISQLPRSIETRAFIEAAIEAINFREQSETIWLRYVSNSNSSTSELTQATALADRSAKAWRELDDKVEDELWRRGLDWAAVGGRPSP
jgi:hypothetical protein